jgi:hypothetical protein
VFVGAKTEGTVGLPRLPAAFSLGRSAEIVWEVCRGDDS